MFCRCPPRRSPSSRLRVILDMVVWLVKQTAIDLLLHPFSKVCMEGGGGGVGPWLAHEEAAINLQQCTPPQRRADTGLPKTGGPMGEVASI